MRLSISTPLATVVSSDEVVYVRGEDSTGAFGILSGHADFLTALRISVLSWRDGRAREHYVAVRGGMLSVRDGDTVVVATPEAVAGEDLHRLEADVLTRFQRRIDEERAAHSSAQRLHLAAIRQIMRLLRPDRRDAAPAG
jgi:F-type H+-transporting ATPase subunit epsilon